MPGNAAEGLMLTGGGMIVGSWLALWVEPSNHKLNVIRIAVCGAISIAAFILWVRMGALGTVLLVAEHPVLGMLLVSVVAYGVFVFVVEPILIRFKCGCSSASESFKKAVVELLGETIENNEPKGSGSEKKTYESAVGYQSEDEVSDEKVDLHENIMGGEICLIKKQLLTPAEELAYRLIKDKYQSRFYVLVKIRASEVIKPDFSAYREKNGEYEAIYEKLCQWSFDFLLCYKSDFSVCCAINLNQKDRKSALQEDDDKTLDKACRAAGIRIERMKVNYEQKRIEKVFG
ncbi:DUF2726 domain-containing protein [Salinicola halophilus]|uniref:DUF2726 domain-containing protein n=1 Tax=Salinicola halophilus TaxID=184065 RepID=UPI000DA1C452|nr:DUF2726 domain-containing protein [Salinicola halophilus]